MRAAFDGRVLAFTERSASLCGGLHVPNRRPDRDAMIVATALEHRVTVVTRNLAAFEGCGVAFYNPWESGA